MKKFLLLALFSVTAQANMHLAPPDFDVSSGRAVFVDFSKANYKITYDLAKKVASVESEIKFKINRPGKPIFDMVTKPEDLRLDGAPVAHRLVDLPDEASKVRVVWVDVQAGEHTLTMKHTLETNVTFDSNKEAVRSAFWIRDLRTRLFIEQYVPTNLEFDQYQMTLDVVFQGKSRKKTSYPIEIMHNGYLKQLSANSYRIEFPEWYMASAPYFHTFPKGAFNVRRFDMKSIDGRTIPFTIYAASGVEKFVTYAKEVFAELEKDYGPWGHHQFTAYGAGSGGMEHAGATMSSIGALDHEMLHSYFAKGVMPSNGNSGWIDEGLANWRDRGYPALAAPGKVANLAGRSAYARNTDDRAYSVGSDLFGHIDSLMANVGGLKAFLRGYYQTYKHTQITVDHFRNNLEFFAGQSFEHLFQDHVYRNPSKTKANFVESHTIDHNHAPLTAAQLKALL